MRLLALILVLVFITACTNVNIGSEVQKITNAPSTAKTTSNATNPYDSPEKVIDATSKETQVEDLGSPI